MARSIAFYCDGLGFTVVRQMDDAGGPFFARLERNGVAVMISNRRSRLVETVGHSHDHDEDAGRDHDHGHEFHGVDVAHAGELNLLTYVYVEDVDTAYRELVSRGIEPVDAPGDKYYGIREFLIRDPDGYYYAIAQRLSQQ